MISLVTSLLSPPPSLFLAHSAPATLNVLTSGPLHRLFSLPGLLFPKSHLIFPFPPL